MKAKLRQIRARGLHQAGATVLEVVRAQRLKVVPFVLRRNFTRSLIELKRNQDHYDFGPTQLRALDVLINLSRKAKTYGEVQTIHRNTCLLGIDKH